MSLKYMTEATTHLYRKDNVYVLAKWLSYFPPKYYMVTRDLSKILSYDWSQLRVLIFRFFGVLNFDILGVYNALLAAWCADLCSSLNLQSVQPRSLPMKRDNCSQGNVSSITKENKLLLYLHHHCYTPRCNYALSTEM